MPHFKWTTDRILFNLIIVYLPGRYLPFLEKNNGNHLFDNCCCIFLFSRNINIIISSFIRKKDFFIVPGEYNYIFKYISFRSFLERYLPISSIMKELIQSGPACSGGFMNLVLIFGMIMSTFIFKEEVTISFVLSAFLVFGGVHLTNRLENRKV